MLKFLNIILMTTFQKIMSLKWVVAVFIAVSSVSSCGFADDDDEAPATYPIEILGVWQGVDAAITVSGPDGGISEEHTESLADIRIAINANGTCVTYGLSEVGEWRERDRSFWKYDDKNKLLLLVDKDTKVTKLDVVKLDSYKLTLKSVTEKSEVTDTHNPDQDMDAGEGATVTTVTTVMNFMRLLGE